MRRRKAYGLVPIVGQIIKGLRFGEKKKCKSAPVITCYEFFDRCSSCNNLPSLFMGSLTQLNKSFVGI